MHPRQANLIASTNDLINRIAAKKPVGAAPVLWKYTDPDSEEEFFLPKKLRTVRSPYTGKSFSGKPERHTPTDVGKELREEAKEPSAAPGPKLSAPKGKGKRASDDGWAESASDETVVGASPMLWKYDDPIGKEFFLTERLHTVHSTYSGKTFPARPERHTPSDVGKELRQDLMGGPMDEPAAF